MIISCVNTKGGVGKTSFSFSLAKDLGNLGYITNDISIVPNIYKRAKYTKKVPLVDNVIYDFGGFIDDNVLSIIKESDQIIVPTINDYNAMLHTLHVLEEIYPINKNIIIIANMIESEKDFKAIKEKILSKYDLLIFPLKRSKLLKNALESGMSAKEIYKENKLSSHLYKNIYSQYKTILKRLETVKKDS